MIKLVIFFTSFLMIFHCDAQENFKIGLLAPLTSDNAAIGQSVSAAVSAALPEVNEYLAPYNMRISLIEKDTASDPKMALTALKELESEGVRIFIGPILSSSAQKCLSYANSKKLILISPSSTSQALSKKDCLFRMLPSDNNQGAALAKYASSLNIRELLTVYIDNSYGKGLEAAFTKAFKEQSNTVLKGLAFKPEELSDIALVNKIADAATAFSDHEHAGILFVGYGDVNTFFENAATDETLIKYRWFTSEALLASSPNFLEQDILSAFAQKTKMVTVSILPDDIITDLYSLHIRKQSKAKLAQGQTLSHFAFPSWDALWIAAEALRKTAIGDAATLKQAIKALGSGDAYYGMRVLRWDKSGDSANGSFYMLEPNTDGVDWKSKAICEINPNLSEPNLKSIPSLVWPPASSAPSITFHGLFPLSGGLDLSSVKAGFELAIQHINEYFKSENINTSLTYVSHDTQTSPDVALGIASDLYKNNSIPIIVGPCVSSVVDNVAAGLPELCLVSPTSTALALAKPDDFVARLCPTDAAQATALATLIAMDGVDNVAIIYRDDIWGQGIKTAFSDSFSGDTKVFAYSVDNTDFTDIIEEVEGYMLAALAEQKAVLLVSFDEAATIFKQIDEQSPLLDYSWYGTDGLANISAMLEDDPGKKAAQTGLQASTYSPYIVDMLSPRLLLFNKWMNASVHTSADPNTVLGYDSTWLAVFAYMLNSSESTPTPSEVWSKLIEEANLLTGFSYAEALDDNADRLSKYYSFYRLEYENGALAWNVANSFMESGDKSKSLKRDGTIADKSDSSLSIKYKRANQYHNGVPITEKKCDKVNTKKLPLGDFRIPENLILENGVMTGTLSVFVDGNYFPCAINIGDWKVSDDQEHYIFTTSKSKMNEDYYPMTLKINHTDALWKLDISKVSLDKLDWSDGVEVRIDVDRESVVVLDFKPELQLKLSFKNKKNGIDYSAQSLTKNLITDLGVSNMSASYSSKSPWKGAFVISKSDLSTTDSFNPELSGVTLKANDNVWSVSAGNDWGPQTEKGIFKYSSITDSSKIKWRFDTRLDKWIFNATGVNTIGIANTLIDRKGIVLELEIDENNKSTLLLKPKINATLIHRSGGE